MKVVKLGSRIVSAICLAFTFCFSISAYAQKQEVNWSAQEKPIYDQIRGLRALPDDTRAQATKQLALQIRQLPVAPNKLRLADALAARATEGDFGHETLQEVATTLSNALREQPQPDQNGGPAPEY